MWRVSNRLEQQQKRTPELEPKEPAQEFSSAHEFDWTHVACDMHAYLWERHLLGQDRLHLLGTSSAGEELDDLSVLHHLRETLVKAQGIATS